MGSSHERATGGGAIAAGTLCDADRQRRIHGLRSRFPAGAGALGTAERWAPPRIGPAGVLPERTGPRLSVRHVEPAERSRSMLQAEHPFRLRHDLDPGDRAVAGPGPAGGCSCAGGYPRSIAFPTSICSSRGPCRLRYRHETTCGSDGTIPRPWSSTFKPRERRLRSSGESRLVDKTKPRRTASTSGMGAGIRRETAPPVLDEP